MIAEILLGILDLVQPYLLKRIIDFVKTSKLHDEHFFNGDLYAGIQLVILLAVVELANVFFDR